MVSDEDATGSSATSTPRRSRSLQLPKLEAFSFTQLSGPPSPDYTATPSLYETGAQLRRTLSYKGLSEMDAKQWRQHLWKDSKPSGKRPKDLDQAIAWAIRGGARSFLLACSARAAFNTLFVLLTALRRRKISLKSLLVAIYGETTLRFGGMMGLFSLIYRFVYHSLRLYNPGPRGAGKEERWHAPLAGALSSLALLAERKQARLALSQQVFVRGLQGLYHRFKKRGLRIPHGDILLFGLSCGQIMYAWLMNPDSLSGAYRVWITDASNMPRPLATVQRTRAFRQPLPLLSASKILETWRRTTPANKAIMEKAIALAQQGEHGPPFALCAFNHPSSDRCVTHLMKVWPIVFRWMMPVYAGLHFVPPLILRRKAFFADPSKYAQRAFIGTCRSSAFLATFVAIYQGLVCTQRSLYYSLSTHQLRAAADFFTRPFWAWFFGFATCLGLFWEAKPRREELALYVLPKALEAFWKSLRLRQLVPRVPHGEIWLNAAGLAIIMDTFAREREALSRFVSLVLYQSVGTSS